LGPIRATCGSAVLEHQLTIDHEPIASRSNSQAVLEIWVAKEQLPVGGTSVPNRLAGEELALITSNEVDVQVPDEIIVPKAHEFPAIPVETGTNGAHSADSGPGPIEERQFAFDRVIGERRIVVVTSIKKVKALIVQPLESIFGPPGRSQVGSSRFVHNSIVIEVRDHRRSRCGVTVVNYAEQIRRARLTHDRRNARR